MANSKEIQAGIQSGHFLLFTTALLFLLKVFTGLEITWFWVFFPVMLPFFLFFGILGITLLLLFVLLLIITLLEDGHGKL